jgi:hypothetical protein
MLYMTRTFFLLTSATKLLGNYKSHFHAMCKEDFKVVLSRNYVIVDVSFTSITWPNLQAFSSQGQVHWFCIWNIIWDMPLNFLRFHGNHNYHIYIYIYIYIVYVIENISRRSSQRNESMKNVIFQCNWTLPCHTH